MAKKEKAVSVKTDTKKSTQVVKSPEKKPSVC
jgi:hypothetical protein